jgi:hypothetical protein
MTCSIGAGNIPAEVTSANQSLALSSLDGLYFDCPVLPEVVVVACTEDESFAAWKQLRKTVGDFHLLLI